MEKHHLCMVTIMSNWLIAIFVAMLVYRSVPNGVVFFDFIIAHIHF